MPVQQVEQPKFSIPPAFDPMLTSFLTIGSRITKASCVLLLALIVLVLGCKNQPVDIQAQFRELFSGYKIVLIDDLPSGSILEALDRDSLKNSHPLEQKLIPGRIFVFRKTSNIENEVLAINTLPGRLKNIGAMVTKAPKSPLDLTYAIIGGPLFEIEFELDHHRGEIFNRVHTSEKSEENWEELIVVYK